MNTSFMAVAKILRAFRNTADGSPTRLSVSLASHADDHCLGGVRSLLGSFPEFGVNYQRLGFAGTKV